MESSDPHSIDSAVEALLTPPEPEKSEPTGSEETDQPDEAENQGTETDAGEEEGASEADEETAEDDAESGDAETEADSDEEPELYTVKVDGVEREVTLEELTAGYSRDSDYRKKTAALAEERRSFEAAKGEAVAEFRRKFDELNTLIAGMDEGLGRYEGIDWDELERSDPEKAARLDREMRREAERRNRAVAIAQQNAAEAKAERLQQEKAKLLERIPAWRDPEVYGREGQVMAAYLRETYGVTEGELSNLVDHRLIDLARKARLYDESRKAAQAQREIARKKVARVPKVSKPGAASPKRAGKDELIAEDIKRARKSGSIDDAAAAVERMFYG